MVVGKVGLAPRSRPRRTSSVRAPCSQRLSISGRAPAPRPCRSKGQACHVGSHRRVRAAGPFLRWQPSFRIHLVFEPRHEAASRGACDLTAVVASRPRETADAGHLLTDDGIARRHDYLGPAWNRWGGEVSAIRRVRSGSSLAGERSRRQSVRGAPVILPVGAHDKGRSYEAVDPRGGGDQYSNRPVPPCSFSNRRSRTRPSPPETMT
jgi:hypothetical protein